MVKKTIPLATMGATNLGEWNRFSIDISDYIKVEPGAFYQVRMSFRKSQSLYFCTGSGNGQQEMLGDLEDNSNGEWDDYDEYGWYLEDEPIVRPGQHIQLDDGRTVIVTEDYKYVNILTGEYVKYYGPVTVVFG